MCKWRQLLIPTIGPHHWVRMSSPDTIKASDEDATLRPISVVFFLEDPRARTQHVYVTLDEGKEFHSGKDDEAVNIWLEENQEGLLQAITVGVFDTSTQTAFLRASEKIYSMLSLWTYQYKRPFSIQEVKLFDKTHQAQWMIPKFCPKPTTLKLSLLSLHQESHIGSLFALFREAMNSTSFAYRFLSYFKIAEAWKGRKGPFAWIIYEARRRGISPDLPVRKVDKEFLGGSYRPEYHDAFLGKKVTWCINQLEEIRALIAHPFNKLSEFTNLDSPEAQAHLGALANLTERIAIQLLEDVLEKYEKIDESGIGSRIRSVYSKAD
jgi:Methylamine utilization protein MauJ